jgi:hypothetical protein
MLTLQNEKKSIHRAKKKVFIEYKKIVILIFIEYSLEKVKKIKNFFINNLSKKKIFIYIDNVINLF